MPAGIATRTRGRSTPCASRRLGSSCACPDDEDIVELFEAARAGIHPAGRDAVRHSLDGLDPGAGRARALSSPSTGRRAASSRAEDWSLPFAVVADGPHRRHPGARGRGLRRQPQRVQRLVADGVGPGPRASASRCAPPCCTSPSPGSARSRRRHRPGIDNHASQRVSLRLGYEHEGQQLLARRGEPTPHLRYRLTREAWQRNHFDGIEIHNLEPCLRAARRCMNLQRILYNHAIMAISDDTACAARRGRARAERGHRGRLGLFGARARAPDRRPPAARAAHGPGALRGLRRAVAGGARALRRRLPLPAPRCEPPVRRGDRGRRHARSSTSAPTSGSIPTGPTG